MRILEASKYMAAARLSWGQMATAQTDDLSNSIQEVAEAEMRIAAEAAAEWPAGLYRRRASPCPE